MYFKTHLSSTSLSNLASVTVYLKHDTFQTREDICNDPKSIDARKFLFGTAFNAKRLKWYAYVAGCTCHVIAE